MTKAELLAEFRQVTDDTAGPPFAWSDLRAMFWLSEGQDKFCKETGFWTDASTYTITAVEGQQDYPISPRIIEVKEVWDGLRRLNKYIQGQRPPVTSYSASGPVLPRNWQADKETGLLSFFEPPQGGIVLSLRVWRCAKVPFRVSGVLEIPEDYHLACVEYAAAKAFGDHDREKQDPVKAKDHFDNFWEYVLDGRKSFDRINAASPRIEPNSHYVV